MTESAQTLPWVLVAACVAAIASLIGVGLQVWNTNRSRTRDALSEIAQHRIRWIEELRVEASQLLGASRGILWKNDVSVNLDRVQGLSELIVLKLNPKEHASLIDMIWKMRGLCYKDLEAEPNKQDFLNLYNAFGAEIRPVLKKEWEKAKLEIKGSAS